MSSVGKFDKGISISLNLGTMMRDRQVGIQEVHEVTNMTHSAISNFANDRRLPTIYEAVLLCQAFDVTFEEMVEIKGIRKKQTPTHRLK